MLIFVTDLAGRQRKFKTDRERMSGTDKADSQKAKEQWRGWANGFSVWPF